MFVWWLSDQNWAEGITEIHSEMEPVSRAAPSLSGNLFDNFHGGQSRSAEIGSDSAWCGLTMHFGLLLITTKRNGHFNCCYHSWKLWSHHLETVHAWYHFWEYNICVKTLKTWCLCLVSMSHILLARDSNIHIWTFASQHDTSLLFLMTLFFLISSMFWGDTFDR